MIAYIDEIDRHISGWMNRYGRLFLRISLAVVFIWFGILKPLGVSAAAELVRRTVYWLPPDFFIPLLGWWEVAIGVGLLFRPLIRVALFLLFLQMPGTVLPLFLLPEVCFTQIPFAPTLEGQYIIKNLILLSAAIAVGGTVREEESARLRIDECASWCFEGTGSLPVTGSEDKATPPTGHTRNVREISVSQGWFWSFRCRSRPGREGSTESILTFHRTVRPLRSPRTHEPGIRAEGLLFGLFHRG